MSPISLLTFDVLPSTTSTKEGGGRGATANENNASRPPLLVDAIMKVEVQSREKASQSASSVCRTSWHDLLLEQQNRNCRLLESSLCPREGWEEGIFRN